MSVSVRRRLRLRLRLRVQPTLTLIVQVGSSLPSPTLTLIVQALLRYVDDDADCLRAVAAAPQLFAVQLFFASWGYWP